MHIMHLVIPDEHGLQIGCHRKIVLLVGGLFIISCKENIAEFVWITIDLRVTLCYIRNANIGVLRVIHVKFVDFVEENIAKF